MSLFFSISNFLMSIFFNISMTQLVLYPQFFFIFASADQVLGYSAGEMCVFFRGEAPHSAHGGQCVICLNRCNWPLMIEVCTSEFTLVSMPPIAPQAMDAGHPPTVHVQFHRVRDIMTLFCFSAVSACGVGGRVCPPSSGPIFN